MSGERPGAGKKKTVGNPGGPFLERSHMQFQTITLALDIVISQGRLRTIAPFHTQKAPGIAICKAATGQMNADTASMDRIFGDTIKEISTLLFC
jgi:hypothetical protein